MKKNDILLLCATLAVAAIIFIVACVFLMGKDGEYALVSVDGEEYARLSLDEDAELLVKTEYGENLVVVKDGKVRVSDADCPDKVCVKTGEATELTSVVCLPHRLTVTVEVE